jgi:hypothetical protein
MKKELGALIRGIINLSRKFSAGVLFIIGIVMSYLFISIEFWSLVGPVMGVAIGSFIAIGGIISLRFSNWNPVRVENHINNNWKISVIICSVYIVGIIIGTRSYLYQRPIWLYILFPSFTGLIGYQISRGQDRWMVLIQLVTLAFFTYWSSQLLFPAGMYNSDTYYRYIPNMYGILETGVLPSSETIYAGHYAMAMGFSLITGLEPPTGYYLVSTLLLVITVLLIGVLNHPLPSLSEKTTLYAALIFACSSWMLRRGFHPNKLNFFYPLILLLGIAMIYSIQNKMIFQKKYTRWAIIFLTSAPAVIFGHQFSAGAAMIFLIGIASFVLVASLFSLDYINELSSRTGVLIVSTYVLSIMGNPVHQQPLTGRFTGLLLSIVQTGSQSSSSGGSAGGAGRYSELPIDFLIASTAAQTVLFALAVIGAIWLFSQKEWEYDLIIFWLGTLSLFMMVSLIFNSADTQPQRFYAYLILFGFNICAGTVLNLLGEYSPIKNYSLGNALVVTLVVIFAVSSLASPVADEVTSPVGDDLPHNKKFSTNQEIAGNQWNSEFTGNQRSVVPLRTNVPVTQTGRNTGQVVTSVIDEGTIVLYSDLSERTGVISETGYSFGGRQYVFVPPPDSPTSNEVYTNGESTAYQI